MGPRIDCIEALPFRVPYRPEIGRTESGIAILDAAEHVLCRVRSGDQVGLAEAPARLTIYGDTQRTLQHMIGDVLGPLLEGLSPFDVRGRWARMDRIKGNEVAKAAVDVALFDLCARLRGEPLYRYLGRDRADPCPAVKIIPYGSCEEMVSAASTALEQGLAGLKVKVGRDPETDAEAVTAIRRVVGNEALIYVDANQRWDAHRAVAAVRMMEPAGIACVEEPVPVWDHEAKKRVAGAIGVPILADEGILSPQDALREIRLGAVGMISIKVARTGIYPSQQIAHLAAAANLRCCIGTMRECGVATAAGLHFGAWSGAMWTEAGSLYDWASSLVNESFSCKNGAMQLPRGEGLGVSIDEEAWNRYALDSR